MFESILDSTGTAGELTVTNSLLCTGVSLVLGLVIALVYMFRNHASRNFVAALVLLPVIVQVVIMMVNGEVGTGVAVMGAFSLVRFRSVPGNAKDICCIFFAMAIGLATGMGYLTFAACATVVFSAVLVLMTLTQFGSRGADWERDLRITIPEDLDYTEVFDDLLAKYTRTHELVRVKTTNMGSLFELRYRVTLKDKDDEKAFIDELRCRNGNLGIVLGRMEIHPDEVSL